LKGWALRRVKVSQRGVGLCIIRGMQIKIRFFRVTSGRLTRAIVAEVTSFTTVVTSEWDSEVVQFLEVLLPSPVDF
jgi:hypothetical protein